MNLFIVVVLSSVGVGLGVVVIVLVCYVLLCYIRSIILVCYSIVGSSAVCALVGVAFVLNIIIDYIDICILLVFGSVCVVNGCLIYISNIGFMFSWVVSMLVLWLNLMDWCAVVFVVNRWWSSSSRPIGFECISVLFEVISCSVFF